jgi:hypothetical protein
MAQQSARRGRKNQAKTTCHRARLGEVVPVRELPYGPAANGCMRGRTDGSIRHRATRQKPLASKGASTDGSVEFVAVRDDPLASGHVVEDRALNQKVHALFSKQDQGGAVVERSDIAGDIPLLAEHALDGARGLSRGQGAAGGERVLSQTTRIGGGWSSIRTRSASTSSTSGSIPTCVEAVTRITARSTSRSRSISRRRGKRPGTASFGGSFKRSFARRTDLHACRPPETCRNSGLATRRRQPILKAWFKVRLPLGRDR